MNLKEILERKLKGRKEPLTKEEAEKALTVFIICFYKFYSRDKRIGYGDAFVLLFSYLIEGYVFREKDYPPLPFGLSIKEYYMFDMVYKVPTNVIYFLIQKI